MLQEKYLPFAEISKRESIVVHAPAEKIFPILQNLDFRESRVIYWLFKLRGIPVPESLSLKGLEKINFIKLETVPHREIILGLIGQFWTTTGRLKRFNPEDFIHYRDVKNARATWNFELTAIHGSLTKLSTETRIHCPTDEVRKKFRFYWAIIQPFSSWIRKEILKSIKRQAENGYVS